MIYLTGDTHGDISRLSSKNFPEGRDLTKDDTVIQLGDFGVIWSKKEENNEKYWMEWLARKPWTTFVVLGNHENMDMIEELPGCIKNGASCWEYRTRDGSVYFVKAGEILELENKKFLCIRGGLSVDKMYRTEGISWWSQEMLSRDEEENTLNNLDRVNWKVDYLLSHATADSVVSAFLDNPGSKKFNDPVSRFIEFVVNKLEFQGNIFGHYHNSRTFVDGSNDYYRCLYHEIVDLDEIEQEIKDKE